MKQRKPGMRGPCHRQQRGKLASHPPGGFTLIELMISIVIVSILATLLFSGASMARGKMNDVTCSGNLRQLASAAISWSNDHDGRLPDRSYWPVFVRNRVTDAYSLHPYLGIPPENLEQDSPLTCPRYKAKYKPVSNAGTVVNGWHRTYGLNMYLFGSISGGDTSDADEMQKTYGRMSSIPSPGTTAFFFDGPVTPNGSGGGSYNGIFQYPEWRKTSSATPGLKGTDYIHDGAIHVAFVDGHVERISEERAIRETLMAQPKPPNENKFWGRKP